MGVDCLEGVDNIGFKFGITSTSVIDVKPKVSGTLSTELISYSIVLVVPLAPTCGKVTPIETEYELPLDA